MSLAEQRSLPIGGYLGGEMTLVQGLGLDHTTSEQLVDQPVRH
jgi:hypothetical protein